MAFSMTNAACEMLRYAQHDNNNVQTETRPIQFDSGTVNVFLSLEHELRETVRLKLAQPRFYEEGEMA